MTNQANGLKLLEATVWIATATVTVWWLFGEWTCVSPKPTSSGPAAFPWLIGEYVPCGEWDGAPVYRPRENGSWRLWRWRGRWYVTGYDPREDEPAVTFWRGPPNGPQGDYVPNPPCTSGVLQVRLVGESVVVSGGEKGTGAKMGHR
jgi:hypothetical protein